MALKIWLGDALGLVHHQIFENPAFAARQRQRRALHFGIAAVEIDPHLADILVFGLRLLAAADRADAGHDLAHMNRLAHHVVDAGGEKLQRLLQRNRIVQGDHRNVATFADHLRESVRAWLQSPIRKASTA